MPPKVTRIEVHSAVVVGEAVDADVSLVFEGSSSSRSTLRLAAQGRGKLDLTHSFLWHGEDSMWDVVGPATFRRIAQKVDRILQDQQRAKRPTAWARILMDED